MCAATGNTNKFGKIHSEKGVGMGNFTLGGKEELCLLNSVATCTHQG